MESKPNQNIIIPVLFCIFSIIVGERVFNVLSPEVVKLFPGFFRIEDTVFLVIAITFLYYFYNKHSKMLYPLSSYSFAYLIVIITALILINPFMAKIHFGQSYFRGLIGYRHLLNYLLFFVFIIFLTSEDRFKTFMIVFYGLILLIGFLSLLQYLFHGLSIFQYYEADLYAEDVGLRLGEYRLIFPGIEFAVLLYFITLSSIIFVELPTSTKIKLLIISFLVFLFIMRLTRMRIIGVTVVTILGMLITPYKKRLMLAIASIILLLNAGLIYDVVMGGEFLKSFSQNLLFQSLAYSYSDLSRVEGNVAVRMEQTLKYWEFFKSYPLFGAGSLVAKTPLVDQYNFGPSSDVGLIRMMAEFGLAGLSWLIALCVVWFKKINRLVHLLRNDPELQYYYGVVRGLQLFFLYMLVTFFNFGHFIQRTGIVWVVLTLALLEIIDKIVTKRVAGNHSSTNVTQPNPLSVVNSQLPYR
jgi:hypothetical protein